MNNIYELIIIFILYSIFGWIAEEIAIIVQKKKMINRGFLLGTWCPIYGVGSIIVISCLSKYTNEPITLFVMCTVICGFLEYLTSYIMEKLFKARWWDYSDKKFNINGRICLETLVMFGIAGLLIMYVINPMFIFVIQKIPVIWLKIISILLSILFITDLIISFTTIYNFKTLATNIKKDNTDEISTKVRKVLLKKSKLLKRLVNAFPNFEIKLKREK